MAKLGFGIPKDHSSCTTNKMYSLRLHTHNIQIRTGNLQDLTPSKGLYPEDSLRN